MADAPAFPTTPALPELLKTARWLVRCTGYPYEMGTSESPPREFQIAVYEAWIERDGVHESEHRSLWEGLCDEGGWRT